MGQYFVVTNPDRRQFLDPGLLSGDKIGVVLSGLSSSILSLLISDGGYKPGPTGLVGSWAGSRIVLAGDDYGAPWESQDSRNLNEISHAEFSDITLPSLVMLAEFGYADDIVERALSTHGDVLLIICAQLVEDRRTEAMRRAVGGVSLQWKKRLDAVQAERERHAKLDWSISKIPKWPEGWSGGESAR